MSFLTALSIISTVGGIVGTAKQYSSEQKAAAEKARIGQLEAKQYVNELFLTKAAAIDAGNRRREEMAIAEASNIAAFSAMGRSDRSVDAFLKRNREIAANDIDAIDRQANIVAAKYAAQAAVAYKFGQNSAAGMRASANANLFTNLSNIAQNLPPSVTDMFRPRPVTGGGGGGR
jgi:hypothetical protein